MPLPATTVLHATLAALQAQLALVFPPAQFIQVILPPKLTAPAWRELTRRTPMIGIGWNSVTPLQPPSRILTGTTRWSVFLVVRNQAGPAPRFLGDALGPGLFDLVSAAAGVLHGHTIPGIGTAFVTGVSNTVGMDWDMEDLVLACLDLDVGATLPTASSLVAQTGEGILKELGITWTVPDAPDAAVSETDAISAAPPRAPLGVIRFDADYEPGSALSNANLACLQPPQFQYRAPFWASDAGGTLSIDADTAVIPAGTYGAGGSGAQAVMDAEIGAIGLAGPAIDFWAFLGHSAGQDGSRALGLYLSSSLRSQINFALIADLADLWWGSAALPALATYAGYTAQEGYQSLPDGRKLFFLLDSGAADVATRYGGTAGLFPMVQALRQAIHTASGSAACLVLMCPDLTRAASLLDAGCGDAVSAYAVMGATSGPTPYAALAATARAWWDAAADLGVPVVPPVMTGWAPSPRAVTPNALWGAESGYSPSDYYLPGTPAQIAAHVASARDWLARQPQQIAAIAYAWNEDTENNGCLWPGFVAGQPAGDASRLAALAALPA